MLSYKLNRCTFRFQLLLIFLLGWLFSQCNDKNENNTQFVGRNPEGASDEYAAPPNDYNAETGYKNSAGGDTGGIGTETGTSPSAGGDTGGVGTEGTIEQRSENNFPSSENPSECALNNSTDQFVEFPWPDDILVCYQSGKLYNFKTKKCGQVPNLPNFPVAEADSTVQSAMPAGQTTLGCNWDDALIVQQNYMDPEGQMSHIGVAEKNDKAKIVGCSEVKGERYYLIIIQYWYPTLEDIRTCKVASNWRIYTSCRQVRSSGVTNNLTWEECLDYLGD